MRLVAAAKVRRAQEAVVKTRPFSASLLSIFRSVIALLGNAEVNLSHLYAREDKHVLLVGLSGDRGLCWALNAYAIK